VRMILSPPSLASLLWRNTSLLARRYRCQICHHVRFGGFDQSLPVTCVAAFQGGAEWIHHCLFCSKDKCSSTPPPSSTNSSKCRDLLWQTILRTAGLSWSPIHMALGLLCTASLPALAYVLPCIRWKPTDRFDSISS
jgi:hypothetical protein